MLGCAVGRGGVKTAEAPGGGSDRSQVTGPPPPPPVWSPADSLFSPSAAALGYSSRGATEVEDGSEKPGSLRELSWREGCRAGAGGGWRNLAAARFGGRRGLPADCFGRGWVFGFARCGRERVGPLRAGVGPESRQNGRRGTNCLGFSTRRFGAGCGKSLAHVRTFLSGR